MVNEDYFYDKLNQHFDKCNFFSQNPRNIILHPVFVVRLCSDTVLDLIESLGGKVIQTEQIWFSELNKKLNERYRDELHHYFYSYLPRERSSQVLVDKLDSLENAS